MRPSAAVMKDGAGAGQQADVSRQELFEDYVSGYLRRGTEVRPCRDALLEKAAQYLLREPDAGDVFTVFPFYQVVCEDREPLSAACRKHLSAFIKATELLETLCVNLFLQPWKKEFKTLKVALSLSFSLFPSLSFFLSFTHSHLTGKVKTSCQEVRRPVLLWVIV